MRIEVVGRNVEVTDEIREDIRRGFQRIAKQVSDLARLEVVLHEEPNPSIRERFVAEATLFLKGATLHAEEASATMKHSVKELAQDMRRQVKRDRELRRKRSQTREYAARMRNRPA